MKSLLMVPLFAAAATVVFACGDSVRPEPSPTPEILVRVQDSLDFGAVEQGAAAHATWSIANDSDVVVQLTAIEQTGTAVIAPLTALPQQIAPHAAARIELALAPPSDAAPGRAVESDFVAVIERIGGASAVRQSVHAIAAVRAPLKELEFAELPLRAPASAVAASDDLLCVALINGEIDVYSTAGEAPLDLIETIDAFAAPDDPSPVTDIAFGEDGTIYVLRRVHDVFALTALAGPAGIYGATGHQRDIVTNVGAARSLAVGSRGALFFSGAMPDPASAPAIWRFDVATIGTAPERFAPLTAAALAIDADALVYAASDVVAGTGPALVAVTPSGALGVHAFGRGRNVQRLAFYSSEAITDLQDRLLAAIGSGDRTTLQSIRLAAGRVASVDVIASLRAGSTFAVGPRGEIYATDSSRPILLMASHFRPQR